MTSIFTDIRYSWNTFLMPKRFIDFSVWDSPEEFWEHQKKIFHGIIGWSFQGNFLSSPVSIQSLSVSSVLRGVSRPYTRVCKCQCYCASAWMIFAALSWISHCLHPCLCTWSGHFMPLLLMSLFMHSPNKWKTCSSPFQASDISLAPNELCSVPIHRLGICYSLRLPSQWSIRGCGPHISTSTVRHV